MLAFPFRFFCPVALGAGMFLAGVSTGMAAKSPVLNQLVEAPLAFEPVPGNGGGAAAYQARGLNYQLRVTSEGACLVLSKVAERGHRSEAEEMGRFSHLAGVPSSIDQRALGISFPGAVHEGEISGAGQAPGTLNYLVGKANQWRTGMPMFQQVRARNLYPGVDVVYYGNQRRLEYDFVVAPQADPSAIRVRFSGADKIVVSNDGDLAITLGGEQILQHRPVIYQVIDGRRVPVSGRYHFVDPQTVGFSLGDYDRSRELIIDPVLSYSTYFGGNGGDLAMSIKVDGQGNIYVAGQTLSTQFPFTAPAGGLQPVFGGGKINGDAFIAKFNPAGTALVYFTYLGGSGNDGALDLAVDAAGNAYLAGFTDSENFPATASAYDTQIAGPISESKVYYTDAFVAKLNPEGNALAYASYYGGNNADVADALAIDPQGHAYIAGYTLSTLSFPLVNPLPGQDGFKGQRDAFVAKFSPDGGSLVYSTFLAGTQTDEAQGIAVDAQGNAYVTGYTSSRDFPTTSGLSTNLNLGAPSNQRHLVYDAFVTKIAPQGGAALFSTFLGGTNSDSGFRVTVDSANAVLVTGGTRSAEFPNTVSNRLNLATGFTRNASANYDAFVTKMTSDGALTWSSRFGGNRDDVAWDVATDAQGRVFVIGTTGTTNFPVANNEGFTWFRKAKGSTNSVFVTAIAGDGSSVLYSVPLSGRRNDRGYAIAADPAGNAYLAGRTFSTNFPTASPFQGELVGGNTGNDVFVAKISIEPTLATTSSPEGLEVRWRAFAPEYKLETSTNSAPDAAWTPTDAAAVTEDGWHRLRVDSSKAGAFFRLRRNDAD